jgi:amino acid transporter
MGSLAQVAGQYVFLLFGADDIGSDASSPWVLLVGLGWIALMAWVCYRGIEIAAAVQRWLLFLEFAMLMLFSVVALIRAYRGDGVSGVERPRLSWLNPFEISSPTAVVSAIVLMLFIYWGWETALTVNEETTDRERTPGRAAIISTFLLLGLYLFATVATLAFAGIGEAGLGLGNPDHAGDVFSALGDAVFGTSTLGSTCAKLMVLMVLTSAAASTETTILTLGRTMLAMGSHGAIPRVFARVHPRYRSPKIGTIATGTAGAILYVIMNSLSDGQVIGDAVASCGLLIAFYYGLTGIACAIFYRHELTKSAKNFILIGVGPIVGALLLFWLLIESIIDMSDPENSYTGVAWLGVGPPLVIGVGVFVVGVVFMIFWRIKDGRYWQEKTSVADPVLAAGGHRDADGNEVAR